MKKKRPEIFIFDEKALQSELVRSAKAVGLSVAVAEVLSLRIAKKVAGRIKNRMSITNDDLNRFVAEEADKYSADLAYVYRNRGKII